MSSGSLALSGVEWVETFSPFENQIG